MGSEPPSKIAAVGTFFGALERLVLFALSLSVGLVNLLIGLAVAARLGVIPKAAADRVLAVTTRATTFIARATGSAPPATARHKAKH